MRYVINRLCDAREVKEFSSERDKYEVSPHLSDEDIDKIVMRIHISKCFPAYAKQVRLEGMDKAVLETIINQKAKQATAFEGRDWINWPSSDRS
tara:strand:+ start:452 stop:733 length:282 start_codon:yes stop_codon:yes gene_type:complete